MVVEKKRPVPTSIRLRPELRAALAEAASDDGRSLSNLIDRILTEWLARAKGSKPAAEAKRV